MYMHLFVTVLLNIQCKFSSPSLHNAFFLSLTTSSQQSSSCHLHQLITIAVGACKAPKLFSPHGTHYYNFLSTVWCQVVHFSDCKATKCAIWHISYSSLVPNFQVITCNIFKETLRTIPGHITYDSPKVTSRTTFLQDITYDIP